MHRCLSIPEILSAVFLNFQTTEARSAGHEALATLARTCTTFQSPALALLWRAQETMLNIILCMPPDLISVDTSTSLPTVRLLRPATASDWDRVLLYAPLVRQLWSKGQDLSLASIFLALNLSMPTNCLFPNLTRLGWVKSTDFRYIGFLLAPRLEHIFIICPPPDINLSFLAALPYRCPLLQLLYISGQHVPDAICGFLDGLPNLTHLEVTLADMRSLIRIGRLPRLRRLFLRLSRSVAIPATLPEDLFLNLEHMTLYDIDCRTATRLVPVLVHAKLKGIRIHLPGSQTTSVVNDLLKSLVDRSCLETSSSNSFRFDHPEAPIPAQSALCAIDTHSLRLHCRLTEVAIVSDAFSLHDCCLSEIARSWTRIRKLELITSSPNKKPVTTLSGLLALARHCRALKTLRLSLDTSSIPQAASTSDVVPQICLISIDVGFSALYDALNFARFISGIFPNLKSVLTYQDDKLTYRVNQADEAWHAAHHQRWKEAEAHIPMFVAVREEGRLLAQR
ncbi:hypothetical protein GGX14DRAFT_647537 [Mycena pura]|uniref:F-box domain-containing protein n=1 Tax=Mycena pura TaxID=153505 RepID=A0AAD6VA64_9AGAR|nr:hypothetical protein GGX14DRAFT_647537 [Mycena pura]